MLKCAVDHLVGLKNCGSAGLSTNPTPMRAGSQLALCGCNRLVLWRDHVHMGSQSFSHKLWPPESFQQTLTLASSNPLLSFPRLEPFCWVWLPIHVSKPFLCIQLSQRQVLHRTKKPAVRAWAAEPTNVVQMRGTAPLCQPTRFLLQQPDTPCPLKLEIQGTDAMICDLKKLHCLNRNKRLPVNTIVGKLLGTARSTHGLT